MTDQPKPNVSNIEVMLALKKILGEPDYTDFLNTNPTWEQMRERLETEKNRIANAKANKNTGILRRITTGMLVWRDGK